MNHLRLTPDGSDCTRCGLCCTSPYDDCPVFVEVEDAEAKKLPRHLLAREFDYWVLKAVWRRQPEGSPLEGHRVLACIALRGALGKCCSCSVYDDRPGVCRGWKPRNATCMRIRTKFADAVENGRLKEAV